MAVRTSNPVEAREIAEKAMHWLRMIREAKTVSDLNDTWNSWLAYASTAGVCRQIREHFVSAYAEVKSELSNTSVRA